VKNT
jgi:ATP-binding cassette, subfamily B (MDR/TAP), member 1